MDYSKAVAQVIATIVVGVIPALAGDNVITGVEWVNVAILAIGALSVFAAPNVPGAPVTKSVLAVLTAVLTLLASSLIGGVTPTEWLQIGAAALGAVGVYAVPNKSLRA